MSSTNIALENKPKWPKKRTIWKVPALNPVICSGYWEVDDVFFCKAGHEVETQTAVAWMLNSSKRNMTSDQVLPCDDGSEAEALLGTYKRTPVGKQHLKPGGKYRAIYKLFIYFKTSEGPEIASREATGWCCMNKRTIATAGHMVWDDVYGRAIAIQAHLGYRGVNSDSIPTHESKMATCVAVHREWYHNFAIENDIALIMLQTPFEEVLPLGFKACPGKGNKMKICVAGYPGDIPAGFEGQYMRESVGNVDFDLQSQNFMLNHKLDTFKGNSGSPVFQIGEGQNLEVIAIHTRSRKVCRPPSDDHGSPRTGRYYRVNQAVPLGDLGNILSNIEQAATFLTERNLFNHKVNQAIQLGHLDYISSDNEQAVTTLLMEINHFNPRPRCPYYFTARIWRRK